MAEQDKRNYELVYILQPNMDEGNINALNERLGQVIASQNGAITATEMWGRRGLAYTIKKFGEGHYVLQHLNMEPTGATEVERFLRLNEDVIRYLMIRTGE
jgi:small subunit ribosomal protein S6